MNLVHFAKWQIKFIKTEIRLIDLRNALMLNGKKIH